MKARQQEISLAELQRKARQINTDGAKRFEEAIRRTDCRMRIIAELKKASPSAGLIREKFEVLNLAQAYKEGGADALSVLTEEDYFQGNLEFIRQIRQKYPELPILRKDFIFDEYQLWEAKEVGADAVLLIVAILEEKKLAELLSLAGELALAAVVEVHSVMELECALRVEAKIIGINNRNLRDFTVNIRRTAELLQYLPVPREQIIVSESGIKTSEDIRYLLEEGVDAVLIGETLMRAENPGRALQEIIQQV